MLKTSCFMEFLNLEELRNQERGYSILILMTLTKHSKNLQRLLEFGIIMIMEKIGVLDYIKICLL